MKTRLRKLIGVVLAVSMIGFAFTACGAANEEPDIPDDTNTETEIEDTEAKENEPAKTGEEDSRWKMPDDKEYPGDNCYAAYTDVLKAYETGIKDYWGSESGDKGETDKENSNPRAVAITDINGDEIPELMFMCRCDENAAELKAFTFDPESGAAVVYGYSCSEESENKAFIDHRFDGGRSIMVSKGAEKNVVYMICETYSGTSTAYAAKFTCGEKEMTMDWNVLNSYDPAPQDENDMFDAYQINGKETSKEKGSKLFKSANDDYGELIMFSGGSDSISAFRHTETDEPLAMTFDQAAAWLSEQ